MFIEPQLWLGAGTHREMTAKVPALWGPLTIRQDRLMLKQTMMELHIR